MSGHAILIDNARVLTLEGPPGPRSAQWHGELGILEQGWVFARNGTIEAVGKGSAPQMEMLEGESFLAVDASGLVLMPTWTDCHTHACWTGTSRRIQEWAELRAGRSYLEILESGGGIMATVQAVRNASMTELSDSFLHRLTAMIALGTGTVEVKTGYGLDLETELKMLRSLHRTATEVNSKFFPMRMQGTFLGAHAIDPDQPDYVEMCINKMLPKVLEEFPCVPVDAYCEEGAWSPEDTERLLRIAKEQGCPIRVHADQFNDLGMTPRAVALGARSVDHLEASSPETLDVLANSSTIGVMLPLCGLHLDDRYADGRGIVDRGGSVAVATNCNPGSAPSPSMPLAVALAVRKNGLTPQEAIVAGTWNAACVLGTLGEDCTSMIAPGQPADFQLLDGEQEGCVSWELAGAGPRLVVIGGRVAHQRAVAMQHIEKPFDDNAEESE
ncbi:MAG: imidazolonepropionase [Phycisphaerae bacterium]|nr:imidazolonepropionase [Phycisphaerae bacterium]